MRGIGRHLQNPTTVAGRNLIFTASPFSTFGRGRGRGAFPGVDPSPHPPKTTFTPVPPPGQVTPDESHLDRPPPPPSSASFGHGQGRGMPLGPPRESHLNRPPPPSTGFGHGQGQGRGMPLAPPPPPSSAPVQPFVRPVGVNQSAGRGRGGGAVGFGPRQQNPSPPISEELSKKISDQLRSSSVVEAARPDGAPRAAETQIGVTEDAGVSNLDGVPRAAETRRVADIKFINVPSGGTGRGKLEKPAALDTVQVRAPGPVGEVNRHMKVARPQARDPTAPRLPPEEAVQKAMEILRKKSEASGDRGRVGGRGRGLSRGRGRGRKDEEDEEVEMYLGDDADGEKLAKRLGPEMMNQLTEVFGEAFDKVSPSPMHEAYEDALQTNYAIELEPEWHFGDVNSNPDIHDTPPIPLRDALEKMKPFIMAYENIQSQEEWEEVVEEVMNKKLPMMKKIVDRYAGDDVVTALEQQQELNRVVDTLPKQSPASIRKFASNSILSLQSNPGWGSKKKFQFMNKLVTEVSKHYQ